MNQVVDFFERLFKVDSWPPRWHCGYWSDFHGWLYIISDLAIWAAYFAIPTFLFFFIRKKKDVPLPKILWLFLAFILLCGITHLIDAIIFWWPAYRISAAFRFITAVVSWITVVSIVKIFPEALKLKTSAEYEKELAERKRVEEDLKIAKVQAERSEQAKEQFLANMSHEIRTPMNAVIGFAQLLEETKLTDVQKEYIEIIQKAGNNLLVVINDILDLSKIEAGQLEFEQTPLDVREQLRSLKTLMEPRAAEKNLKLSIHVDSTIPANVVGDAGRLTQVLLNLTSNAIKFTNQGEVSIYAQLVHEDEDQVKLLFLVRDTGIGIPQNRLEDVFKRFTQTHASGDKTVGTGLGLTIVKHLVELQEGSVTVNSEMGKGSDFSITLPFKKKMEEGKNLNPNKSIEQSPIDLSKLSILIVEDNEVNRKLMKIVLSGWNINTDFACNGLEAVDMVQHKRYNMIFMDIQMPVMGGYQATRLIRNQLHKTMPIIALTAHAMSHEVETCLEAGMNDFMSKPFSKDDFYAKIIKFAA